MSKNPVVPFILIFAFGLGLIFFMSLYGLEQKRKSLVRMKMGQLKKLKLHQQRNSMLKRSLKENVSAVMVAT